MFILEEFDHASKEIHSRIQEFVDHIWNDNCSLFWVYGKKKKKSTRSLYCIEANHLDGQILIFETTFDNLDIQI